MHFSATFQFHVGLRTKHGRVLIQTLKTNQVRHDDPFDMDLSRNRFTSIAKLFSDHLLFRDVRTNVASSNAYHH